MLEVVAVPVLTDNYVWLIHDPESGDTAAVDPSVAAPVLDAVSAKGLRLTQASSQIFFTRSRSSG